MVSGRWRGVNAVPPAPTLMKRSSRFSRRAKTTPDTELLVRLATQLAQSASRVEDVFWEPRLAAVVDRLLREHDETAINSALDQLYSGGTPAYDELADLVEACAESRRADTTGGQDVLLIAVPVLAWSRFAIPAGTIAAAALAPLRVQLQAHVLARDAKLGLADFLFSPDQLPQSYVETAQLAEKLGKAALHDRDCRIDPAQLPETVAFLSDTRHLIAAVAAPRGAPMFRWQEDDGDRAEAQKQWQLQGGEALRPLLTGCAIELLPAQAYHAAVREADRASRPYSLRAAVAFLQTQLNRSANELRAVVAPYFDRQLEEFRIGFGLRGQADVLHGVVWPLLDHENEAAEIPAQIEAVLNESGIGDVLQIDHRLPLEWCDDCGTPLYPNAEGESVHAELPEEQSEAAPRHLH